MHAYTENTGVAPGKPDLPHIELRSRPRERI